MSIDNGTTWVDISGATGLTYSFTATAADNGKQFRVVLTNGTDTVNSNPVTLTVGGPGPFSTSTTLSSSMNPSVLGQSVTFTATVTSSGGTPTGTVTLKDGGVTLSTTSLSAGVATFDTASLSAGTHSITAEYGGSADFLSSASSVLSQNVVDGTSGPLIAVDDRTVAEGSAVNAAFRVFLSGPHTSTVTVQYATADNTALAGSDYSSASGTLSFSPGRTQHSIFVPIASDATPEGGETFFVNLTNPTNATLQDGQAVGTIHDPPSAAKIAMYRSYNKSTDYHFFTTDLNSKNFAVGTLGFQDESNPVPFYVWNVMQSGTTGLFRMYNPNLGRHFYTASSGSRDFIMSIGGVYEKEEGFVYPLSTSPVPAGATELFLLYNNNSGTHLFTADASQKDAILNMFPGVWVQHTSVGYVFTSP